MSPKHGKGNHPANAANPTRANSGRLSEAQSHGEYAPFREGVTHPEREKAGGPAVCVSCHAIRHHKHWHLDESRAAALLAENEVAQVTCPACHKIAQQDYDGQVVMTGAFVQSHHDEIMGLVRNTEATVRAQNPMARIASVSMAGEKLEVLTISSLLAERIGKEVRRAYDGLLEVKHTERQEFIRVTWFRES